MTTTVRTFRAPDARAALAAVKEALGPNAIILATQTVRVGIFGKTEIEVTAALEPERTEAPAAAAPAVRYQGVAQPKVKTEERVSPAPESVKSSATQHFDHEMKTMRTALEDVRHELRLVSDFSRSRANLPMSPAAADLLSHLEQRGVERRLGVELVKQAIGDSRGGNRSLGPRIHQLVADKVRVAPAAWLPGSRRVIALVGPTGVGKTTTLAKIAARALIESRISVALITVDTYRVGATAQMARYGEIMNIPTQVATSQAELVRAVERCSAELVLIDTSGRSIAQDIAQQVAMLRSVEGVQLHLVLSAATGPEQLAANAERYRALQPDQLIFTKIDEAVSTGGILSAAVRIERPVTCITDGQRVPEDLHALTATQLVDLIVGSLDQPATATSRAG